MAFKFVSKTTKNFTPLNPTDFKTSNVEYTDIKPTKDGSKYIYTTYKNTTPDNKQFLIVVRGCKVLAYSEGKNNKYTLYVQLCDTNAMEMIRKYEKNLTTKCFNDSLAWFGEKFDEEESTNALKSIILSKPEFPDSYTLSLPLSDKFVCKSKIADIGDDVDIKTKLAKFNMVDVCLNFKSLKINKVEFNIIAECNQANLVSVGKTGEYKSTAIMPENFTSGKITLSKLLTKTYPGSAGQPDITVKSADVLYEKNKLRVTFKNINSRFFKFIKDGKEDTVSYSLSLRLPKSSNERKMFEGFYDEIFKQLIGDCKEYYDNKKYTPKQLKAVVKSVLSYNKTDQEKIKKNEEPENDPSFYFKVPFDKKNSGKSNRFYGKIINEADNSIIDNIDELLGKDLNISTLETYCKGVSFHAKGTSIIFTIDKCYVNFDVPEYNMDSADTGITGDDEDEEETDAVEATADSDDEEAENSDSD